MKEQEIIGFKWNILFYSNDYGMFAQIYDKETEDIILEDKIKTQEDYDFALEVFTTADNNVKKSLVEQN